ncbi:helix-turn-helix domain-containing protein [Nocardia amikacinitolerans]|uniref:helix-turn-helix domain-containing protein n=1 Tax=Nocardia amikacinitolerans TaxID=756689 RepID=UPI0020A606B8|nr:helix-turn-helix domain-containing protein [Nocardia amikacinitolerans]
MAEREETSRGLAAGCSGRTIAVCLGRSPSTIAREIVRNGGRAAYRAAAADHRAYQRARRPKPAKLTDPASCAPSGRCGIRSGLAARLGQA